MKPENAQQPGSSAAPSSSTFTLAQVLSITTGRLCCDIGDVYEILNHVTGDSLFTHVLPRASQWARPMILELHPQLAAAGTEQSLALLDEKLAALPSPMMAITSWMDGLKLPESFDLPCWSDRWLSLDPIAEAQGMFGEDKVAVVTPDMSNAKAERQ